ncbi:sulfite exporter TauE/SafE family protein [Miltoncostaea marina]|uniref:sulfite exporter TauE/SafE family protein n=1 Tax=Miltoncostaea marina TaxID=2843215 RepID=UPI001C3C3D2A|nr:sulfite exporter TauE/SafE family protein [Miltoncostaea marina]
MTADVLLLVGVGILAGGVNAIAGGGSLLSFPVLIATGMSPLTANVTNTIAQLPGYVSIVGGYWGDLAGQGPRLRALLPVTAAGAGAGVAALALGGEDAFEAVVPWLVLLACALLAVQPRLRRRLAESTEPRTAPSPALLAAVFLGAAYSTYFGAAAGVLILAVLALGIVDRLGRLNALNRALILAANAIGAPALMLVAPVDWAAVATLAPATLVGGYAGARVARLLPDHILRIAVIAIGVAVAVWLLVR